MATGMQQIRETIAAVTCSATHPLTTGATSRVQGAMEIDAAFQKMAIDNCIQTETKKQSWFGNSAGAPEQFAALREAALDANFKGNASFSLAQVEQLRAQLRNPSYNEQQAKALVTTMVNHAVSVNAPGGEPISEADRKGVEGIINRDPQVTPPAPAPTPSGTQRSAPPKGTAPAN